MQRNKEKLTKEENRLRAAIKAAAQWREEDKLLIKKQENGLKILKRAC